MNFASHLLSIYVLTFRLSCLLDVLARGRKERVCICVQSGVKIFLQSCENSANLCVNGGISAQKRRRAGRRQITLTGSTNTARVPTGTIKESACVIQQELEKWQRSAFVLQ